jgi:hypothetical protein
MSLSQSANIHRRSGLAGCTVPTRPPQNPNSQASVLIGDHTPARQPEPSRPLRQVRAASGEGGRQCRCGEKGCVFPADQGGAGICRQHRRERREPTLFHSLQITGLLLDAAKLGLPNSKRDLERQRDRRRLEAVRERFLEELA